MLLRRCLMPLCQLQIWANIFIRPAILVGHISLRTGRLALSPSMGHGLARRLLRNLNVSILAATYPPRTRLPTEHERPVPMIWRRTDQMSHFPQKNCAVSLRFPMLKALQNSNALSGTLWGCLGLCIIMDGRRHPHTLTYSLTPTSLAARRAAAPPAAASSCMGSIVSNIGQRLRARLASAQGNQNSMGL